MWKKIQSTKWFQKMKQIKVSKTVVLSAAVIVITLSVLLTVTLVNNRAKRSALPDPNTGIEQEIPQKNRESDTKEPPQNEPSEDKPTMTDEEPPILGLPAQGVISKSYSKDIQVFSRTMNDYRVHLGLDVSTAESAPVYAMADGTVSQIWEDPLMGWCLAVNHSGDCQTVYKNLAPDFAGDIATGVSVKSGQLLGTVGDTSVLEFAEEPHLHLEMMVKGESVDPMDYFSASVIAALTEDDIYEEDPGK